MGLIEALQQVVPDVTRWLAVITLVLATLRSLRVGDLVTEAARPFHSMWWERRLLKYGASDKEVRRFVQEFALKGQGRSP